jgi:hypothetical protein
MTGYSPQAKELARALQAKALRNIERLERLDAADGHRQANERAESTHDGEDTVAIDAARRRR